jgi:alkylhydroperoxidase family enzyme
MPYFPSLAANAGPPTVYTKYPAIYGPWSKMSEALMNGPSSIGRPERELLFAYAAGVMGCTFVQIAHSEVAYASGVEHGTVEKLLEDPKSGTVPDKMRPLLEFIRKLSLTPGEVTQEDADAVFEAGWDEQALHDAIALTGRAAFMQCLVQGHGFLPIRREEAAKHAKRRLEQGYVNLYPAFRETKTPDPL